MQWEKGDYTASDAPDRLDIDVIHRYLSEEAYWAEGRGRGVVERSIAHSDICLGIYDGAGAQIGFARVVTDTAVFAYVCDVFVLGEHRGQGLGKWLVQLIVDHPLLQDLKHITLLTGDAQDLYRRYGFETLDDPERFMLKPVR